MYCIIQQGGHQYEVKEGDIVQVPYMAKEVGSSVDIASVVMAHDDTKPVVDRESLEKVTVQATVRENGKGKKVRVMKKKGRKRYQRTRGHRAQYTSLEITKISAS